MKQPEDSSGRYSKIIFVNMRIIIYWLIYLYLYVFPREKNRFSSFREIIKLVTIVEIQFSKIVNTLRKKRIMRFHRFRFCGTYFLCRLVNISLSYIALKSVFCVLSSHVYCWWSWFLFQRVFFTEQFLIAIFNVLYRQCCRR